ncbi:thioredoxin TrxC [Defluviimonas sp. WL0075]|uniref:Thioredoxin TrxC n=1 Tax=Albidovulum sediminicola TaxID=2984331 RepID=A0ABT2Z1Q4_9RHOB|nr:thioredoxin TrxC [Defluviimonas sp. WL0075]MCV2865025.1 thioredoxin TrxC [Defluviimonas sp. WL0075]
MTESFKLTCATCGQTNRVPAERIAQSPKCGTCGDPLAGGKVAALDPAVHDKMVRGDTLPLLVDYWAPWCGPCRMMAPQFAQASMALKGRARLAKINTEDHPQISQRLGIRGIPLLILYAKGREVARLAGARPAAEIEAFVRQNAPAPA